MKSYRIEYRDHSWDNTSVIVVSADSPQEAIKKAGIKNTWEYIVSEPYPMRLGNSFITLATELIRHTGRR